MTREAINTPRAPKAIGTYSQAIRVGNAVYVSGQIPFDPATGELIEGDMRAQVRRVFDNLREIAIAAGTDLHSAVRMTVYLLDFKHFPIVNEVMAQYCNEPFPARVTVGVASLPRGAQVEIDCVLELT